MRAGLLALVLLVAAGSAAATPLAPTPLTAEALLAADVSAATVKQVAGGNWWPEPPAFDTVVFQSDPQPKLTTGVTFEQLGGDAGVTTTLYAFRSPRRASASCCMPSSSGPPSTSKPGGRRAPRVLHDNASERRPGDTALLHPRARRRLDRGEGPGLERREDRRNREADRRGHPGLLSGKLAPPPIAAADLARMPADAAAPGPLLGTATISPETWATVDRDAAAIACATGSEAGREAALPPLPPPGVPDRRDRDDTLHLPHRGIGRELVRAVRGRREERQGLTRPGSTGARSAYRQGRDNFELRFAVGRFVGDVFCYAPFVTNPSAKCEAAVRSLAERWYAQLSRAP